MMRNFVFIVLVSTLLCLVKAAKLPANLKICHRTDPNLNDCFKKAVQAALPLLKDGFPSLGIGSQEPLKIESMTVDGNKGAVDLQQKFKNLEIFGVTNAIVDEADIKIEDKELIVSVNITLPHASAEADYNFDGKILMLPLQGDGKCTTTMDNAKVKFTMQGELVDVKGKTHVKLNDLKVNIIPEKAIFKLDNLFNGNKEMGDQMNKMINANWKSLFDEVKASYDESFGAVVRNVADTIFAKVPYDQLLPA